MVIDAYFNQIANKDDSLTSLNTAFANEGAYINIPKSKVADKPIEIMYFSTGNEAALLVQPRNLAASSESVLLRMMNKLEKMGCAKSVVGLVIPTGYSF